MASKNEQTSKKVASTASKLLKEEKSSKPVKSVSASALTQAPDKKKTLDPAKFKSITKSKK